MQLTEKNQLEFYKFSITNSRAFWADSAKALNVQFKNGYEPNPSNIVDATVPKYPKWFPEAQMNIADTIMYHAKLNPEKIALIYKDEIGNESKLTYKQLDELSNQFANALTDRNIGKGDYIALASIGMNPESIASYIGAMKVGAVTVSILPSSPRQMDIRLKQIKNEIKLVVTQNGLDKSEKEPRDLYEKIKEITNSHILVIDNHVTNKTELKQGDINFDSFTKEQPKNFETTSLSPEDHVAVLFSSGTTGTPKATPWRPDCYIKGANDARLHMQVNEKDVMAWPSNFGWMMGSFDIAAAFMNGATLAVYEGNVASKEFGQFIQDNKVTKLGLVPRFGELWQNNGCMEGFDFSSVKMFMSTGAPSNPDNYSYVQKLLNGAKLCEYSGGTEIAGAINTCLPYSNLPVSKFDTPAFGTKIYLQPEEGSPAYVKLHVVVDNEGGYVPPMGLSKDFANGLNHDEKYPLIDGKFRPHGDTLIIESGENRYGEITDISNLQFRSGGRDLLNINGVKVGFEEIEQWILNGSKDSDYGKLIKDIAVFQTNPDHGNKPIYYIKLDKSHNIPESALKGIFTKILKEAISKEDNRFAVIGDIRFDQEILRNGAKVRRAEMQTSYQNVIDRDKSI